MLAPAGSAPTGSDLTDAGGCLNLEPNFDYARGSTGVRMISVRDPLDRPVLA